MSSSNQKSNDSRSKAAIIGGIFIIIASCIGLGIPIITWALNNIPAPISPQDQKTELPSPTITDPLKQTTTPLITSEPNYTREEILIHTETSPPTNTPTETPTPTITNTPTPTLTFTPDLTLFEDNFDTGPNPAWNILRGDIGISNGQLKSTGTLVMQIGDSSWTNYTVSFFMQTIACWMRHDVYNGLWVRIEDIDNAMVWRWRRCSSHMNIFRNGNRVGLEPETGGMSNKGVIIKVVVNGEFVTVYIDDERRGEFYNSTFPNGGVILRIEGDTFIDDFKIERIP